MSVKSFSTRDKQPTNNNNNKKENHLEARSLWIDQMPNRKQLEGGAYLSSQFGGIQSILPTGGTVVAGIYRWDHSPWQK